MLLLTHNYLFFKKKEIWFYDNEPVEEGSYTVFSYSRCKLQQPYNYHLPEQSARIDLKLGEAMLFSNLSRTYKYHVRKAPRLGFRASVNESPSSLQCKEFVKEFKVFADSKKFLAASARRIAALQRSRNLIFTHIKKNDKTVITHAYIHDSKTILLLHSFNSPEQCTDPDRGIANKYLHWHDMMQFRQMGFQTYDLGGINFETVPGISRFKLDFGAELYSVDNYIRMKPWLVPFVSLFKAIRS